MSNWFLEAIGILGFVSSFLIIGFVTLRSILEIAHTSGLLPRYLEKSLLSNEERIVRRTLSELGVLTLRPAIRQLSMRNAIAASEISGHYTDAAKAIIKSQIRHGSYRVGPHLGVATPYYIALREELTSLPIAKLVGAVLVAFLRDEMGKVGDESEPIQIDSVVGHRDGSPLLAAAVADMLDCPCAFYGENRYVHDGDETQKFTIDGAVPGSAILVDESTVDGHMLMMTANGLRSAGLDVRHAFVIFRRTEGGAEEALKRAGVTLHSVLALGSAEIKELEVWVPPVIRVKGGGASGSPDDRSPEGAPS